MVSSSLMDKAKRLKRVEQARPRRGWYRKLVCFWERQPLNERDDSRS